MPRKRTPLAENAFDLVKTRILHFEYKAGDVISDFTLAKELDMSRTPVREALIRLQDMGLLESSGGRMVVTHITIQDIREIYEVREAVERFSCRLIGKKGGLSEAERKTLVRIHEEFLARVAAQDLEAKYDADDRFHAKLVECSGNRRMLEFFEKMRLQIQRVRWLTVVTPHHAARTTSDHEKILRALVTGNEKEAEASITAHLEHSFANYSAILKDPQWQYAIACANTVLLTK